MTLAVCIGYTNRAYENMARVAARTDLRRIVRALEVFELTGVPFSEWHQRHRAARQPRDAHMLGLMRPRDDLYRRIEQRVDEMFARGLVGEVRRLIEQGKAQFLKRIRPLGYIEVIEHLEGNLSLDEAINIIKQNSRRYAKRQMTWFRKEDVRWVQVEPDDDADAVVEKAISMLPKSFRARLG